MSHEKKLELALEQVLRLLSQTRRCELCVPPQAQCHIHSKMLVAWERGARVLLQTKPN